VPGLGTARYYTGPFTITNTATVKAVGMWGSANQPSSYPSGYGYVPSSVVSAVFSGAGSDATPTLVSAYLGSTGSANTMVRGNTLQFTAIGEYSDGSSATIPDSDITWSSSNAAVLSVASSGLVTAVAAGVANVEAKIGALLSSPWTVTVSAPTLVSAYLKTAGDANTIVVGHGLQFTAYGVYSDGSVAALPDSQGDAVTGWNTTDHAVAKISIGGHAFGIGVGTASIEATIGRIKASGFSVTVTAVPSQ
jgi:hypothetical protein